MKGKVILLKRLAEVKKEIMTSSYGFGRGWLEANTEYRILCWVLDKEVEDLQAIKNAYILATIV